MKKKLPQILIFLLLKLVLAAQDSNTIPIPPIVDQPLVPATRITRPVHGTDNAELKARNIFSPLITYNFSGKNPGLSGLTPIINYGYTKPLGNIGKRKLELAINPYVSGQIGIKDSTTFLPALMLPGIAGLNIQSFVRSEGDMIEFIWSPINFGLKLNTNFVDSNKIIVQHNLRTGFALLYKDFFQLGLQYSYGWHNSTSESEQNFKETFVKRSSDIHYITCILEVQLSRLIEANEDIELDNSNIIFFEWRGLINRQSFASLPNTKILSIGFRKSFNLNVILPAANR